MARVGGVAGITERVLFWLALLAAGLLRPGYDHVRQYVSDLAVGQNGWLMTGDFYVSALLQMLFAYGVLASGDFGRAGPLFLSLRGAATIVIAIFPGDVDPALRTTVGMVHNTAVVIGNLCFATACALLARRFVEPSWRRYTGLTGALVVALLVTQAVLTPQGLAGPSAPLAPWAGLVQRASILAITLWVVLMGVRLVRRPASRSAVAAVS